jgi:type II secretory pathway pseudopilin PulG
MQFSTPFGLSLRAVVSGLSIALAATVACLVRASAADHLVPASSSPVAVAEIQSFRGRIDYVVHRVDAQGSSISGQASIAPDGWVLEERQGSDMLHASPQQSWLREGGTTLHFDDAFEVHQLANAWALLLAAGAGEPTHADPSGTSWTLGNFLRVYPTADRNHIAGVVDLRPGADVSFSFDDWTTVNGLSLPQSIVRFADGVTDGSFIVDSYRVSWAPNNPQVAAVSHSMSSVTAPVQRNSTANSHAWRSAWRSFATLFELLLCGLLVAAWFRRDALVDGLCRLAADDPRAWRDEGTSMLVSPEGLLWFQGRYYQVGAQFYNRRALIQSSPLFLRISAAGVSRSVVLARKFPLPWLASHGSAAGFTLLEALVATALFASVVVAAVMPTLVVLAHADRVAELHEGAVQLAANALVDEESALAYGSISDSQASSTHDGMLLTVTVAPSSVSGLHQVTATVDDSAGTTLARITTMVGPPVPAPESSSVPQQNP